MFCSQKCAHNVNHIRVLQPKGSSPTKIVEGLESEHFLYSALARQASPAIDYPQAHMYKATLSRSGFPIIFLTGVPSEGDTHILAFQAAEEESDSITLYVAKGEPHIVHIVQSLKDLVAGVTAAIITMSWQMLLPSRVRMLWSKLLAAYWMNYTEKSRMAVLYDTIAFIKRLHLLVGAAESKFKKITDQKT